MFFQNAWKLEKSWDPCLKTTVFSRPWFLVQNVCADHGRFEEEDKPNLENHGFFQLIPFEMFSCRPPFKICFLYQYMVGGGILPVTLSNKDFLEVPNCLSRRKNTKKNATWISYTAFVSMKNLPKTLLLRYLSRIWFHSKLLEAWKVSLVESSRISLLFCWIPRVHIEWSCKGLCNNESTEIISPPTALHPSTCCVVVRVFSENKSNQPTSSRRCFFLDVFLLFYLPPSFMHRINSTLWGIRFTHMAILGATRWSWDTSKWYKIKMSEVGEACLGVVWVHV